MKGPLDRTKVALRHLPPSISRDMLTDQIDLKFSCSYSWLSVIPSSSSQKRAVYSRAYINFHKAEDVILSLPNSSMVMFLSMKQVHLYMSVEEDCHMVRRTQMALCLGASLPDVEFLPAITPMRNKCGFRSQVQASSVIIFCIPYSHGIELRTLCDWMLLLLRTDSMTNRKVKDWSP